MCVLCLTYELYVTCCKTGNWATLACHVPGGGGADDGILQGILTCEGRISDSISPEAWDGDRPPLCLLLIYSCGSNRSLSLFLYIMYIIASSDCLFFLCRIKLKPLFIFPCRLKKNHMMELQLCGLGIFTNT